jgi:hypothetical protein
MRGSLTLAKLTCAALLALACAASSAFASAAVQFQGRVYDVTAILPDVNVPLYSTNDLIFLQDISGNKFLVIPTNVALRGDFDILNQRFYVLNNFNVNSFNRIDAAVLDLNAQFIKTIQQDSVTPIDTYLQPLQISETAQDISIINSNFIAYRTDGPQTTTLDEKIYVITRTSNSTVVAPSPFLLPLKNSAFPYIQFDPNNQTFLTVQRALDPLVNTDVRHRISSFNSDGTLNSQIILDDLNTLDSTLGFTGNTGGMTLDPETGVIYLLDSGSNSPTVIPRKIFAFTPRIPRLTSITPNKGSFNGGTSVTLTGVNFPADAQVFFDTLPATKVTVVSTTTITAVTPAHAIGAVDVTVTGSTISAPLKLAGGYTYVNVAPAAALTASPTTGLPPLNVLFNVGGSSDLDGSLVSRTLDFGDGNVFTFPNDLLVVDTTHTYLAVGTFIATLTVTDNLAATGTATQTIVVGAGGDDVSANDLVLRDLSFAIKGAGADTVKFRAEFPLPDLIDLANADVVVGYGGATSDILLDTSGLKPAGYVNFKLKLLNKRGFPANTYTLSLNLRNQNLRDTFIANNVDLTKSGVTTMQVFVRIVTEGGRLILHTKPTAVITVRTARNGKSSVTLKRQ